MGRGLLNSDWYGRRCTDTGAGEGGGALGVKPEGGGVRSFRGEEGQILRDLWEFLGGFLATEGNLVVTWNTQNKVFKG